MHLKITFGSLVLCLVTETLNDTYLFPWAVQNTLSDAGAIVCKWWLRVLVSPKVSSLSISNEVKQCFPTWTRITVVSWESTGESFSNALHRPLILLYATVWCYYCSRQLWFRNNHVCLNSTELDKRFKLIKCYKQSGSVEWNTDSLGVFGFIPYWLQRHPSAISKACACSHQKEDMQIRFSHLKFAWKKNLYEILSTWFL